MNCDMLIPPPSNQDAHCWVRLPHRSGPTASPIGVLSDVAASSRLLSPGRTGPGGPTSENTAAKAALDLQSSRSLPARRGTELRFALFGAKGLAAQPVGCTLRSRFCWTGSLSQRVGVLGVGVLGCWRGVRVGAFRRGCPGGVAVGGVPAGAGCVPGGGGMDGLWRSARPPGP